MVKAIPEPPSAPTSDSFSEARRTLEWVGPFAVFLVWLSADKYLPIHNPGKEILRDLVVLLSIIVFSRRVLPRSAPYWPGSIAIGIGVCALWIAPDSLIPGWRDHWLFQNSITGRISTSIPQEELSPLMLILRTSRAALLVPV